MTLKLWLASLFTIALMASMLLAIFYVALYFFGVIDLTLVITLVVVTNVLTFFLSPTIQDLLLKWLYKVEEYDIESFKKRDKKVAEFIEKVAKKEGFRPPKIFLVADDNPTAFCYGSTRSRARIVMTKGLYKYLNTKERLAVVAHEMGHIVNRDFIIMTFVSTLVQLMYVVYSSLRTKSDDDNEKFQILALVSYAFYIISQYFLLFLSRLREYYADEYSAKQTSPEYLASALVKIAYGITKVKSTTGNTRFVEYTGAMGIMNLKASREGLLINKLLNKNPKLLGRLLAYDTYSPWAKLLEISSTHPLTGKRIKKLIDMSGGKLGGKPITVPKPNYSGLWGRFLLDLFVLLLPRVSIFVTIAIGLVYHNLVLTFSGPMLASGLSLLLKAFYSYPRGRESETTVLELMTDPYASPVRGKKVLIKGKIIGRAIPGFILSEDFMIDDGSGIIYIDYLSWLPVLGDWFFALSFVSKSIGKTGKFSGWFFRGMSGKIALDWAVVGGKKVKSYPYLSDLFLSALLIVSGLVLMLV